MRKFRKRPGPKSVTRSRIEGSRSNLGESSTNDETDTSTVDDRTPADTTVEAPQQSNVPQLGANNQSNVRSSDAEYSQMRHLSPPRCSTMRNPAELSSSGKKKQPAKASAEQQKGPTTRSSAVAAANSNEPSTVVRRPRKQQNPIQRERRFWKDVQKLQNRVDNITPKLPFSRLVRELLFKHSTEVTKITAAALTALHLSTELYITQRLQDAYMLTLFRGRVTLDVKDMKMVEFLKMNLHP